MALEWPYDSKFAPKAPIFVIKALHKQFVWAFLTALVVFVATNIGNDWQPSWFFIHLLRNNICKNEFLKISYTQQHKHVLKSKYYKYMTIESRLMEIPILVFGPLLWPNDFIVLNFVVLASEKIPNQQHPKRYFIENKSYHYLVVNIKNLW